MDLFFSETLVNLIYHFMVPTMLTLFVVAVIARVIIYVTVRSEWRFTVEFEHRVESFLLDEGRPMKASFQELTKELLDKTHYEYYLLKAKRQRRRFDYPVTLFERVFAIVKASERIIEDTIKQTKYVKMNDEPDFDRMAKYIFASNPYYNRFLGMLSKNIVDDLLNLLPGLLIIFGILGTFVGIVGGIPDLRLLDVTNVESTSVMLNAFLDNMSFAMTTSILGMSLSLVMTVVNASFSPYATYVELIDIYKNSLSFVWKECQHTIKENQSKSEQELKKSS